MITFKKLFWKNFLSTGNAGTTLLLNKNKTTLVQGASGAGKSTMIDALCFGLYGKPFRDINKPGLVNAVNGKQLEVEVEFDTNGRSYKVVRGIKPNRFDIFCDGKLMTQDAAVRDYQKVLEQQILMMSFKTFTQIVILGSTSFTPFMQLPAGARREVIEDILDIGIFSTMNLLLKQQMQETKDQQANIESEVNKLKERALGLKRLVETLNTKNQERVEELETELKNTQSSIKFLQVQRDEKSVEVQTLNESIKDAKKLVEESNGYKDIITRKIIDVEHEEEKKTFFHDKDSCPTCLQDIENSHKQKMLTQIEDVLDRLNIELFNTRKKREEVQTKVQDMKNIADRVVTIKAELKTLETKIDLLVEKSIDITESIAKLCESKDVETPKKELKTTAEKLIELTEKKKLLLEQRKMQEAASLLLKDTGIKTAIVREYIPLINKFINKYLADLQMDVEFVLDEQFNESVRARYRDEMMYGNFSEGERLRLDVALLLTWRHIAKTKNSASCNLLVIDEVLSGRLDPTNQDIVIDLINQLSETGSNIFIIAHQDSLQDKFRSNIRFEKQGNFSVMI